MTKAPPGSVVNNNDPNYIDGALLSNDAEWFAYGGLLRKTAAFNTEPAKDLVSGYRQYQYGTEKPGFAPGLFKSSLETDSTNVTRYIAFGGAASAPSENLAWYFSGVQTESKGPIYTASANRSTSPTRIVDSLITLDMKEQQNEQWKNSTLPPGISGRANPELVWVPVGAKGILVVLGGVVFPDFISVISGTSENETESVSNTLICTRCTDSNWQTEGKKSHIHDYNRCIRCCERPMVQSADDRRQSWTTHSRLCRGSTC